MIQERPVCRSLAQLGKALIAFVSAVCCAASPAASAQPVAVSEIKVFNIAAQPLEQALLSYAEQAGVQIIAPSEFLQGFEGRAVHGEYSLEDALDLILGDSPLEFAFSTRATVYLTRTRSSANADAGALEDDSDLPHSDYLSDEAQSGQLIDSIIVTGTRLENRMYKGIAPVETIRPQLERLGGRYQAADMIRRTPIAMGSFQVNQQLAATLPGGRISNGGSGANGLSLRGLGNQRSLILLDGRRLSPAGIKGFLSSVDLNVIPASALEETEIIKNGSSSVYGADAIAGVVNNITKKNYDGGDITLVGVFPTDSGGERFFTSGNYGRRFDDGWISVAAEYSHDRRLKVRDRGFLFCSKDLLFDPSSGARADLTGPDGAFKCRNHNPNGAVFSEAFPSSIFQPDSNQELSGLPGDGVTRPFLPGWARVGNRGLESGAEERETFAHLNETSTAYENADAISPMDRIGLFVNGEYNVTPSAQIYGSFLYNHRRSEINSWMFLSQLMAANHPNNLVAEGLRQAAGDEVASPIVYQLVRPYYQSQSLHYLNGVLGAKGELSGASSVEGWAWDVYASYGISRGTYSQNFLYKDRLDAISLGGATCDSSFLNPTLSPPFLCDNIDIPVLSERFLRDQNWTAQERDFLEGRETGHTTYEQFVVEGTIGGAVVDLPAGPVEAVLGGSFRLDSIDDLPGPNALAANLHLFSTSGRTKGSEEAREIFAEIGIPIAAAEPLAEEIALVGSMRYTNYRRSGDKFTYQAGLRWRLSPELAIHGSYGTSFRGPNLFELYLSDSLVFNFIDDPCEKYSESENDTVIKNCASLGVPDDFTPDVADAKTVFGGALSSASGEKLRPETARTFQAGFEFSPTGAGITLAIDYFDIRLKDEIGTLGAQQVLDACYTSMDFPDNAFCASIDRAGANPGDASQPFLIRRISQSYTNIDLQRTRGIEFLVHIQRNINDYSASLDVRGAYEFEDEIRRSLGDMVDVTTVRGQPNEPKFAGLADFVVSNGEWSFYYNLAGIGSSGLTEEFGGDTFQFFNGYNGDFLREKLETGFTIYHSISVAKNFSNGIHLGVGVNNLLDRRPPKVSVDWRFDGLRTGTAAQNSWDLRGRRLFVSINKEF